MSTIDERLAELGIELPEPTAPVANFVPYTISGSLVFISGQISADPSGKRYTGKVGTDVTVEEGAAAARLSALNILAQLKQACASDLDQVKRCVKLSGFVNADPGFSKHPQVVNGASDLIVEVFGDKGKHARFAVGAGSLPFQVAVEVDAIFEIDTNG